MRPFDLNALIRRRGSWKALDEVELLGLSRQGAVLHLNPCFPKDWPEITAAVTLGDARFAITILNPEKSGHGVASAQLNSIAVPIDQNGVAIPLIAGAHVLTVVLGKAVGAGLPV